jgi:hypothetical protein
MGIESDHRTLARVVGGDVAAKNGGPSWSEAIHRAGVESMFKCLPRYKKLSPSAPTTSSWPKARQPFSENLSSYRGTWLSAESDVSGGELRYVHDLATRWGVDDYVRLRTDRPACFGIKNQVSLNSLFGAA